MKRFIRLLVLAVVAVVVFFGRGGGSGGGDSSFGEGPTQGSPPTSQATPAFSPPPGTYTTAQNTDTRAGTAGACAKGLDMRYASAGTRCPAYKYRVYSQ